MPAPSLFGKKVELNDRTMVRRVSSPQARVGSPLVHRGLMFADGTPYRGGKGHNPVNLPHDHEIINPSLPPADGSYSEPVTFLPGGQPVHLGRRTSTGLRSGNVTPRSSSPGVSAHHGTGRRHISPHVSSHDSPIRHDLRASTSRLHHKNTGSNPRDHLITGVCERGDAIDTQQAPRVGIKYMDGCPTFQPPAFDKRPYTPQTKRVVGKRADSDIFNVSNPSTPRASVTPVRSSTPVRMSTPLRTTTVGTGSGIRRGVEALTPARSPAPYAIPSVDTSVVRARTPSRASPGSSHFNIITGKAL